MTNEHSGVSRRKLLRTTAIGVPAAGMLAFGSTLVTAPSANAATVKVVDGLWGKETSAGVQRLMNLLYPQAGLVVDGHKRSAITHETAGSCYVRLGVGAGQPGGWFAYYVLDA